METQCSSVAHPWLSSLRQKVYIYHIRRQAVVEIFRAVRPERDAGDRFNQASGGKEEKPEVYNALRLALQRLGSGPVRVLHGHERTVHSLAVSPDGSTLASGAEDGQIRLLDLGVAEPEPRQVHSPFPDGVRALAWDDGGTLLAGGSFGGVVRVWDSKEPGAKSRDVRTTGATVNALAFQPGRGARLVAGDCAGAVQLWDLGAGDDGGTVLLSGVGTASCEPAGEEP
ncbi:MAG: hypothetical protein GY856_43840 [bacterium]|nr:hypothetical protein [bacterium]